MSNPFSELKLASFEPLIQLGPRGECPRCGASRKYFCYTCFSPLTTDPAHRVHLTLPIVCDVIHYRTELLSKSTAVHAKVIAPETVQFHEFPSETLYEWNPDDAVLLFPSEDAINVEDLDFDKIKHVVFVECQWSNAKRILKDPRVSKLKHVRIRNYETRFWRWQNVGNEGLATIEAIYYFYREYLSAKTDYEGQVDNLLYFFAFYYTLVQDYYKSSGKNFRRIKGYINDDPNTATSSGPNHNPALAKRQPEFDDNIDLSRLEEE